MIDPKAPTDDKLSCIRRYFTDAIDHYDKARGEMHRAARFYHNTDLEGQWEWDDLQALRDEGRPAFSFNLIAPKLRTWIGQYEDGKRRPKIVPAGGEDKRRAELLERICDAVYQDIDVDDVDEEVLELGIVYGEANWALDVEPDPERPLFAKINLTSVLGLDLMWDPGSTKASRKDAGHFFWSRWMRKGEFILEYPEHADAWDELEDAGDGESGVIDTRFGEMGDRHDYDDQYQDAREDAYFYDRHKHRIRVAHCEYRIPHKVTYLVNPATGDTTPLSDDDLELYREWQRMGQLEGVETVEAWRDYIYTIEFVGSKILYESTKEEPYQPFDEFSAVPFTCYLDWESQTPYGQVRNLFDPQSEVNKARSVTLEHLADAPKTGLVIESGAVEDQEVFDSQMHTSGENAYVKDGAVAGNKILPIPPPQPSPAAMERLATSKELLNEIANIETEIGTASGVEAFQTHFLRWHKSRLGQKPIITNFERGQRRVKQAVVKTILTVMPDEQIAEILSDDQEWAVQGGVAYYLQNDPQTGQPTPVEAIPLRDLRQTQYNVDLETSSDNTMINMAEHQGLMALHTAQVPVPPDLLAEGATTSRSKRDELRKYARETAQRQAMMAQQMQEAQLAQLQGVLATENAKTLEESRHNRETEMQDFLELLQKGQLEVLKVWEKADEAEKQRMMALYQSLMQQQAQQGPRLQVIPGGA